MAARGNLADDYSSRRSGLGVCCKQVGHGNDDDGNGDGDDVNKE